MHYAFAGSCLGGGAQFVAQRAAQDLADVGLGQLGCGSTRASVPCSPSVRCGYTAIKASAVSARILLYHEQCDHFAGILVRLRHRGDLEHARGARRRRFRFHSDTR